MQRILVFGFGSYFQNITPYKDIDLLLVHADTTLESCAFAIKCKTYLTSTCVKYDVTMLSISEEKSQNFISISNAIFLAEITEHMEREGFKKIISTTSHKI